MKNQVNIEKIKYSAKSFVQFPFYKSFIDLECRKDILTQNEHLNKKTASRIINFLPRMTKMAKLHKFRLIYFISFIVIFKMEPVYNYFFCQNSIINWLSNNYINYYTDYSVKIEQSAINAQRARRITQSSQRNQKIAEIFYKIDKILNNCVGYDQADQKFVDSLQKQISIQKFVQICTQKYANFSQVELNMRTTFKYF